MIAQLIKDLLPINMFDSTYIGELPTDVDNCIAINEYGGPHGTYFAKDQIDTPYITITVRNVSYPVGYENILVCKNVVSCYTDAQLLGIVLLKDITYLGRDEKRRNVFQIMFKVFSYLNLKNN